MNLIFIFKYEKNLVLTLIEMKTKTELIKSQMNCAHKILINFSL